MSVTHSQLLDAFSKFIDMLLRKLRSTMSRHWMVPTLQREGLLLNLTAPCRISVEKGTREPPCRLPWALTEQVCTLQDRRQHAEEMPQNLGGRGQVGMS